MFKLCIFAGTTEGRELIELLAGQPVAVTACVATEYGEALLTPREHLTISNKRMTQEEMEALFCREGFDLVVDATHPYAAVVTENISAACQAAETEYLRLLRGTGAAPEDAVCVPDIGAAVAYLAETEGNILLTTGSKELTKYTPLPDFAKRVYARVLPMESSLSACREAGLGPDRIIAMQGPFSREMNVATLKAVSAKYMVTKDTGSAGGFAQKAAAAKDGGGPGRRRPSCAKGRAGFLRCRGVYLQTVSSQDAAESYAGGDWPRRSGGDDSRGPGCHPGSGLPDRSETDAGGR